MENELMVQLFMVQLTVTPTQHGFNGFTNFVVKIPPKHPSLLENIREKKIKTNKQRIKVITKKA
jgi:hypothetical protein